MVLLVTDIDEPKGIGSDSPWVTELSIDSALAAKGSDKVSSCVKDLNSVVVSVGNDILSNFVDCHTGQAVEFTLAISVTAKTEPMLAVFVKNLNAVIGGIGYDDRVVGGVHRDPAGPREKPGLTASRPKSHQEVLFLLVITIVDLVVDLFSIGISVSTSRGAFFRFGAVFVLQVARPRAQIVVIRGQASR